jgi:hypothetical protein
MINAIRALGDEDLEHILAEPSMVSALIAFDTQGRHREILVG